MNTLRISEVPTADEWSSRVVVDLSSAIPNISCCYAFTDGDRVLYVGKAHNLRARMALHQWKLGRINGRYVSFDPSRLSLLAVPCSTTYCSELERRLIRFLSPESNIHFNRAN